MPRARVQLFTARFCAYCNRARELLQRHAIAFEEIDLGADPDRCCALEALTGGRSTPQVLLDGRPIGGFEQLAALERTGALSEPMLMRRDAGGPLAASAR